MPRPLLTDDEAPLWYRGLALGPEADLAAHVDALLAFHGVSRIVIGHTVAPGVVLPRFGGKVILIDVGLSAVYGGPRSSLEIKGDDSVRTAPRQAAAAAADDAGPDEVPPGGASP